MESLDEFVQSWWRRHSHLDVRVYSGVTSGGSGLIGGLGGLLKSPMYRAQPTQPNPNSQVLISRNSTFVSDPPSPATPYHPAGYASADLWYSDLYDLIEAEGINLGLEGANHEARRVSLGKKMHQFKNRKVGMFYIRKGRRDQRSNVKPLAA